MTVNTQEPDLYRSFVALIRRRALRYPISPENDVQRTRTFAGRVLTANGAIAAGLNASPSGDLGDGLAIMTSIATANSVGDGVTAVARDLLEIGINRVVDSGGFFVAGGRMILEGTYQAINRTDESARYLLGTRGVVDTLARLCVSAMQTPDDPHTSMPRPLIPDHVRRTGAIYSNWQRQAYMVGYEIAGSVINEVNTTRPINGDEHSKQCLIYLGQQTGLTGRFEEDNGRLRSRCEAIIKERILRINLNQQAEELQQWSNAA